LFATDPDLRVRVITASSIHEAFLLASDDEDTTTLRDALHDLLLDESVEVMAALC
jgi:hypothetical protein